MTTLDSRLTELYNRSTWWEQVLITYKYLSIIAFSKKQMLLLILWQGLLLALFFITANSLGYKNTPTIKAALILYALLSLFGFLTGIYYSLGNSCKERRIITHAFTTGYLRLGAYVCSYFLASIPICAIQSVLMTSVFAIGAALPASGILLPPYAETLITTFLTILSASGIGFLIFALFIHSISKARVVGLVVLLLQIVFSGMVISVREPLLQTVSGATISRWSIEGYGATANFMAIATDEVYRRGQKAIDKVVNSGLNAVDEIDVGLNLGLPIREFKDSVLNSQKTKTAITNIALEPIAKKIIFARGLKLNSTASHLAETWALLGCFAVCYLFVALLVLYAIRKMGGS